MIFLKKNDLFILFLNTLIYKIMYIASILLFLALSIRKFTAPGAFLTHHR